MVCFAVTSLYDVQKVLNYFQVKFATIHLKTTYPQSHWNYCQTSLHKVLQSICYRSVRLQFWLVVTWHNLIMKHGSCKDWQGTKNVGKFTVDMFDGIDQEWGTCGPREHLIWPHHNFRYPS